MGFESIRVAFVGPETGAGLPEGAVRFNDVGVLPGADPYDVVILDQPPSESCDSLRRLRSSTAYSHALIYLNRRPEPAELALSDGEAPVWSQLLRDARIWHERHAPIAPLLEDFSLESRLLAWLWVGPERRLRAQRNAAHPELYTYPLLDALKPRASQQDDFWTLRFAAQQDWIRPEGLLDRVRLCTRCGSGHLNYVDVCTECQSLAIARQRSLHCFVCGHVGAQEKFTKDRGLFCPNCLTQLRHIGSDYDRPMENFRCADCRAFFVDALVQVRCLDCDEVHAPDELTVREIHDYTLTDVGRLYCRQGLLGKAVDIDSRFEVQGLLKRSAFVSLIDWLLDVEKRYKRMGFSIVGIRLENLQEELQRLGERRGYALLDTVVKRLTGIIRETDRCMRTAEDVIWLLLPETDAKGAARVEERLGALMSDFEQNGADIDLQTIRYTASEHRQENEDASLLLGRLLGELAR